MRTCLSFWDGQSSAQSGADHACEMLKNNVAHDPTGTPSMLTCNSFDGMKYPRPCQCQCPSRERNQETTVCTVHSRYVPA